jgi:hypothetical protein
MAAAAACPSYGAAARVASIVELAAGATAEEGEGVAATGTAASAARCGRDEDGAAGVPHTDLPPR